MGNEKSSVKNGNEKKPEEPERARQYYKPPNKHAEHELKQTGKVEHDSGFTEKRKELYLSDGDTATQRLGRFANVEQNSVIGQNRYCYHTQETKREIDNITYGERGPQKKDKQTSEEIEDHIVHTKKKYKKDAGYVAYARQNPQKEKHKVDRKKVKETTESEEYLEYKDVYKNRADDEVNDSEDADCVFGSKARQLEGDPPISPSEFESAVQDVQKSNELILKILDDFDSSNLCTCECHQSEKEIEVSQLKTRIRKLEHENEESDERIHLLHEQVTALKGMIQEIRTRHTIKTDRNITEKSDPVCNINKEIIGANFKVAEEVRAARTVQGKEDYLLGKYKSGAEDATVHADLITEDVEFISDEEVEGSDLYTSILIPGNEQEQVREGNRTDRILQNSPSILKSTNTESEKTNDDADNKQPGRKVKVIQQTETKCFHSKRVWIDKAAGEVSFDRISELMDQRGPHTVICVDISATIAEGNGWSQTTRFCHDYFDGIAKMAAEHCIDNEYVALVTFGHTCGIAQRFTNNMDSLMQAFDSLDLGGPSPMFGGMCMAHAAAVAFERMRMRPKIVVITDGRPTDATLYEGPDTEIQGKEDSTMDDILTFRESIFGTRYELTFVPVGNANKNFFDTMKAISNCEILRHEDSTRLCKRLYLTEALTKMKELSNMIKTDSSLQMNEYEEDMGDNSPPVGTRVRRGPDWHWHDQDGNGPGTIIGIGNKGRHVWVHWDNNDFTNIYQYNSFNYDVLPVDEPRLIVKGDRLKVGCVVKSGKDWNGSDTTAMSDKGVVIKILPGGSKIQVRWDNGNRGDYTSEVRGKQEVEFCPPDQGRPSTA